MADNEATVTTQGTENTAQNTATEAATNQAETKQESKGVDNLETLIQRAVDRATNKMGNDMKKLREENERLKKEKLSEDEIKQLELKEKAEELAERDKKLTDRENRLFAIKAIKEIGLDDGSDASLAIVDFVMADTEDGIKERVKSFDALVKRIVKTQVDGVFKTNGRTPGVGNTAPTKEESKNTVAVQLGKNAAKVNEAAQNTLNHYLGGKK